MKMTTKVSLKKSPKRSLQVFNYKYFNSVCFHCMCVSLEIYRHKKSSICIDCVMYKITLLQLQSNNNKKCSIGFSQTREACLFWFAFSCTTFIQVEKGFMCWSISYIVLWVNIIIYFITPRELIQGLHDQIDLSLHVFMFFVQSLMLLAAIHVSMGITKVL